MRRGTQRAVSCKHPAMRDNDEGDEVSTIGQAEAAALMMASLCISVVKDDPELVKRLRKLTRKSGAPFDDRQVSETALAMINLAVTSMALRAAEGGGFGQRAQGRHEHRHRETVVVPVPHMEDGAAKSAGALAAGSFAVEYLHAVPGVLEAFNAWMDETHPGGKNHVATTDELKGADQVLTMMAHVAGKLADGKPEEVPGDAAR